MIWTSNGLNLKNNVHFIESDAKSPLAAYFHAFNKNIEQKNLIKIHSTFLYGYFLALHLTTRILMLIVENFFV